MVTALQTPYFSLGNGIEPHPEPFAKVSWHPCTGSTSALGRWPPLAVIMKNCRYGFPSEGRLTCGERIRKRGSLLPFLREIGPVCSISSEGQRVRAVKAERRTKAFVLDVGGKEVSVVCSFLLASPNPVPRGVQGLAGPLCM